MRRSTMPIRRRRGALRVRTAETLILWNQRGVRINFRGMRVMRARILKGGWYAKIASDFTPSSVRTARRNCISAVALATMVENVLLSMETRIVRKSVFPRNAKATMRMGPRSQWKSTEREIPVPSRPNQTQSIHLEMVMGWWMPFASHTMERRKPPKHQTERRVRTAKSFIMARRETKSMFSDMRLNASLGMRTGAPMARTSTACWPGTMLPVRHPWMRRIK